MTLTLEKEKKMAHKSKKKMPAGVKITFGPRLGLPPEEHRKRAGDVEQWLRNSLRDGDRHLENLDCSKAATDILAVTAAQGALEAESTGAGGHSSDQLIRDAMKLSARFDRVCVTVPRSSGGIQYPAKPHAGVNGLAAVGDPNWTNIFAYGVGIVGTGLILYYMLRKGVEGIIVAENALTGTGLPRGVDPLHFDWPVTARTIASKFGYRIDPTALLKTTQELHNGIDIGVPVGTAIRAPLAGKVAAVYDSGRGGNQIVLAHQDPWGSGYAHLSQFAVSSGQQVARGQVIGYSGGAAGAPGSGKSTGPHLHFTITYDGKAVNPEVELNAEENVA